ncbi:MAG: hypothetical protein ACR2PZ_21195, partial [Pseudomonadales bacterium]
MIEKSPIGLIDLKGITKDPAHDWQHDFQLLNKLAVLLGMKPFNLLRKISWSVGESTDTALFFMGQPLSAKVRTRLQSLMKERLQVEDEIIDNCCHASSQIVQLVPYVIGLVVIS